MKMPFGKFRGVLVADLPDEYLAWLKGLDDLREPLRTVVEAEWGGRTAARAILEADPLPGDVRPWAEELVTAGYRQLAQRHHPDRGGTGTAMQLVNGAAEWLRRQIRRWAS